MTEAWVSAVDQWLRAKDLGPGIHGFGREQTGSSASDGGLLDLERNRASDGAEDSLAQERLFVHVLGPILAISAAGLCFGRHCAVYDRGLDQK